MPLSLKAILLEPEARWSGFPPQHWLVLFSFSSERINQAELARATWLWTRRPKRLLFTGTRVRWFRLVTFVVLVATLCCFDVIGILAAAGVTMVAATLLTLDLYRSVFWKRDYDASIARILRG
jgi:hypothetical protein